MKYAIKRMHRSRYFMLKDVTDAFMLIVMLPKGHRKDDP